MSAWPGKKVYVDRNSAKQQQLFNRMAAWHLKENRTVAPREFLRKRFHLMLFEHNTPYPKNCYGKAAGAVVREWEETSESRRTSRRNELQVDIKNFDDQVAYWKALSTVTGYVVKDITVTVLRSPTGGLSSLFRFCIASRQQLTELAAKFQLAASLQYLVDKDLYDDEWGKVIPLAFRREADNWRQSEGPSGE